jgi:uncharacterized protein YecE (DUF72 family)
MGELKVATCGFSYDDWVGPFYPREIPKQDWLEYYSLHFPFVELDYSYYRMPEVKGLKAMAERSRPGFLFSVKAHRSLTHEVDPLGWKAQAEAFRAALAPLATSDRLAAALFQFPNRFRYTDENRLYLGELCAELSGLPLFVEFRSADWLRDSVFEGLRKRGLGYVIVDEPALPRLPDSRPVVTADSAYLRFHGRNAANWWDGDNVSRYDYLYDKAELEEWLPPLREIAARTTTAFLAFNNHHNAQAVKNAKMLNELIIIRKIAESPA